MTPFKISEVRVRGGERERQGEVVSFCLFSPTLFPPSTHPHTTLQHFYMPKFDTSLKDTQGRTWLGNPWEKDGLQGAVC